MPWRTSAATTPWPGQLATLVALLLYLGLPSQLTIGPAWPLPVSELAVLAALFLATRRGREARRRRAIAIGLVLVAALANLVALGLLVDYLVHGGTVGGPDLIGGGGLIWVTNLLLFAVIDWELDRGARSPRAATPGRGGARLPLSADERRSLRAARLETRVRRLPVRVANEPDRVQPHGHHPLTLRVKVLMGIQGVAALITTGVIIARAVNAPRLTATGPRRAARFAAPRRRPRRPR